MIILPWIISLYNFLKSNIFGFFVSVVDYLKILVTESLPNFVWSILPAGVTQPLQDLDLTMLTELATGITWFFPIWGIMAIYFVVYSIAAGIRLVRFVLGWIPTVEG